MLDDLDRLMEEASLDWIVAQGSPRESPDVFYLLGGARVGHAVVLKRRGEPPFAIVGAMERDEARRAGLRFAVPNEYGQAALLKLDIPPVESSARLLAAVLDRHEVAGRVSFVGDGPLRHHVPVIRRVLERCPRIAFAEELDQTAIGRARETKSADEVARIRSVAARTEEVVRATLAYLGGLRIDGAGLVDPSGAPVKIGHVKAVIRVELARRGLDDHGETIFAAGREAGFPHSRGDEALPVPVAKPIIFDIFPHEKGGGYFYDMTRTYWIGEPGEAVRKAYAAVAAAFDAARFVARAGMPARDLDAIACDVLEARGYVTKRKDPETQVGYLHGLGHGVGLAIHERPALSLREGNRDLLERGQVFTIEPGLYYPDDEMGVRIEDTFYVDASGRAESLATLDYDPELTVGKG